MRMFGFKPRAAVLLILVSVTMQAQSKFNALYETQPEVVVELQTSHTSIIVEPWNRNEVKVEAYLEENDLTQEERLRILESWNLDTRASQSRISIRSAGQLGFSTPFGASQAGMRPREMSERMNSLFHLFSEQSDSVYSIRNLHELRFDFEAYRNDGAAYLEQWEQQVKEKLGSNAQVAVHTWSSSSGDDQQHTEMQQHVAQINQFLEEARSQFENRYGLMMQEMSERFMSQIQLHAGQVNSEETSGNVSSKIQKTIRLRLPANAQLILRVRHGVVNLKGELKDMRASISYAPFMAETIGGENTLLQVSYAPIKISQWNSGELQASYTPSCEIGTVRSLQLTSNSGELKIGKIIDTAFISGTFGTIEIVELDRDFRTVNVRLNNSDLNLRLPNAAFDFAYDGLRSEISLPEALKIQRKQNYNTEVISGHHKSENPKSRINIRAEYSKIGLQL